MTLEKFFMENPKVGIGVSGGVDSSYLLYAAHKYDATIKAYYIKTAFQPEFEFRDAKKLSEQLGVELNVLELDIMSNASAVANERDRCYHCKKFIFGALLEQAHADGCKVVIDGTNATDDASDRPGIKALLELGVRSPLRECGIKKMELRRLSKEAGLFTWDKPPFACLATRIPHGQSLTSELLKRVEMAEESLSALGFSDFRVRVHDGAARLQFQADQIGQAITKRTDITKAVKQHFPIVLIDLDGR
ncbi:MAG: ATP-dependent sacrificial sulfur transferase LarE [Holophagaceae bacterium]|nr:ATP-dependent sacrificial sulfur transferase LarE [Holophagaceae bacterium]